MTEPLRVRIHRGLRVIAVSYDQWAGARLFVIAYWFWGGPCPSEDETISSRVGRAQLDGDRWGLIAAPIIDRVFVALGEAPGHCRRNIEAAFLGKLPTV